MDITSYIKSKLDEFRNTVTTGYNKVADALPLVPNTSQIQSFVSSPVQYMTNPKYNSGNNIYSTSPFQVSGAVQHFIESPKSTSSLVPRMPIIKGATGWNAVANYGVNPMIDFYTNPVTKGIIDPTLDAGANIGRTLTGRPLLDYQQAKSPITKAGYQLANTVLPSEFRAPADTNMSFRDAAGNAGGIALPIIDAAMLNIGGHAVKDALGNTVKSSLKSKVFQGAKTLAPYGLASGVASSLDQNRNTTGIDYIKNVLADAAVGTVGAAVMGAGGALVGELGSKVFKAFKESTPGANVEQAGKAFQKFARDEIGRFVGKDSVPTQWIEDAQISNKQRVAFRKALGLPLDGNYGRGSVDLNAKIDTGIFKSPYERGDIGKIQAELENMLGVPSDAGFKQKQATLGQNYAILQQAADAGAPGAPEAVARAKELFSAIELAQKGKTAAVDLKLNEPIGTQIDRTQLTGRQLDMTNEQLLKGRKRVAQPETQGVPATTQNVDPFLAELDAASAKRTAPPSGLSPSETARQQRQMIQEEMKRPYVEKKYSKNVPDYTSSDAPAVAGKAEYNASDSQGGFMDHFKRWIGKREAAKTRATQAVQPIVNIPKEISWDVVRAVEEPNFKTTPEVKKYATQIRSMYDSLIAQAQKAGVDVEYLKNYITHQWKESPEQIQQMLGAGQRFKFSLERQIPTYQEGISMGLTPKYTTPAQIMESYVTKLEQTKANLDFFNTLKKNGIVVEASIGSRTNGFKPIDAAGFPKSRSSMDGSLVEGQYYAPAKVADTINRVFNPQEAPVLLQKAANTSSGMQNVLMSGGAPKTPLNSWSVAQATKEFMAGRIKKPVVSFMRSFSGDASNKYFSENAGQIIKMQERQIPVSTSWNASDLIDKGSLEKHLGKDFATAFEKLTGEATFKRFMPQLQISFFNDAEASLLKKGYSATEAADIAAQAVKNFYGVKPVDVRALSNPTGEAIKTAAFFAPQYRESMLNFWFNNIKSVVPVSIERGTEGMKFKLNNPLSPQNASNTKFMIGSLLALAGMDQANRALNDGRSMWNNPKGDEDKLFVPVSKITGNTEDKTVIKIPWLSSLAFLPRTGVKILKAATNLDFAQVGREAKGFLSTPLRPLADVGTNQDYFQNPVYDENAPVGDKAKSIGGYLLKEYGLQHPYAKTAYDAVNGKIASLPQGIAQATELPIRFTTTDKINSQYYYQNKDQALSGLNASERKAFDSLPKYDMNNPSSYDKEDSRLRYAIFANNPKVFEAKKAIELASAKQNGTPLDPIYLLSGDEARAVFTFYQASPGSQERRDLKSQYPIINSFLDARTKYFNDKDMQAIQDQFTKGQITKDQADAATQALNDKIASFASGGSKKPKKIASSRVRKVRFSKAKVKIGKFKMFKFPKLAKLKKYKVKKLTARA